jgi:plastocyanin
VWPPGGLIWAPPPLADMGMLRAWIALGLLLVLSGCLFGEDLQACRSGQAGVCDPATPASVTIVAYDFGYLPVAASVSQGQAVEFRNIGPQCHPVLWNGDGYGGAPLCDGERWRLKATDDGSFGYHCGDHASMGGVIDVVRGPHEPNPPVLARVHFFTAEIVAQGGPILHGLAAAPDGGMLAVSWSKDNGPAQELPVDEEGLWRIDANASWEARHVVLVTAVDERGLQTQLEIVLDYPNGQT